MNCEIRNNKLGIRNNQLKIQVCSHSLAFICIYIKTILHFLYLTYIYYRAGLKPAPTKRPLCDVKISRLKSDYFGIAT